LRELYDLSDVSTPKVDMIALGAPAPTLPTLMQQTSR
jgi:hypothetical protein